MELTTAAILIVALLILVPLMTMIVSMCAYVGKVWAIRILFKEDKKEGGEESG